MSSIPLEGREVAPPDAAIIPDVVFRPPSRIQAAVDPKTGQPKRGRGRPPGSPNKPKVDPNLLDSPPMRLGPGPSAQRNPPREKPSDPVDGVAAKKAEKAARATEYSVWINEELNDKLFMFFLGVTGLPPEAIYTAGSVPLKAKTNPNLTELGNRISIPVDLSDSLGKIMAELSYTKAGATAAKAGDNSLLAIGGSALVAIFSGYRYWQGLKPIIAQLEQAAAERRANENTERNNDDGTQQV